jgi:hypothetical protein
MISLVGPGEAPTLRADNYLQKGAGDLAALTPNGYFRSFPHHDPIGPTGCPLLRRAASALSFHCLPAAVRRSAAERSWHTGEENMPRSTHITGLESARLARNGLRGGGGQGARGRRAIAIIRQSCSDSLTLANLTDGVCGRDRVKIARRNTPSHIRQAIAAMCSDILTLRETLRGRRDISQTRQCRSRERSRSEQ